METCIFRHMASHNVRWIRPQYLNSEQRAGVLVELRALNWTTMYVNDPKIEFRHRRIQEQEGSREQNTGTLNSCQQYVTIKLICKLNTGKLMTWILELKNNRSHVSNEIYYLETSFVRLTVKTFPHPYSYWRLIIFKFLLLNLRITKETRI
jgi:hypothetical protein